MRKLGLNNEEKDQLIAKFQAFLDTYKGEKTFDMKFTNAEKANVFLSTTADAKIKALVNTCDTEIAWHGLVTRLDDSNFLITDIILFPQTVTGGTVQTDDTEYALWLAQQPDEIFDKIRMHGHSHVRMATSPSAVDTNYQDAIMANLDQNEDFYIFQITNKNDSNWWLIVDFKTNVIYENIDITTSVVVKEGELKQWCTNQMEVHVTKYTAPTTTIYNIGNVHGYNQSESYLDSLRKDIAHPPKDDKKKEADLQKK